MILPFPQKDIGSFLTRYVAFKRLPQYSAARGIFLLHMWPLRGFEFKTLDEDDACQTQNQHVGHKMS